LKDLPPTKLVPQRLNSSPEKIWVPKKSVSPSKSFISKKSISPSKSILVNNYNTVSPSKSIIKNYSPQKTKETREYSPVQGNESTVLDKKVSRLSLMKNASSTLLNIEPNFSEASIPEVTNPFNNSVLENEELKKDLQEKVKSSKIIYTTKGFGTEVKVVNNVNNNKIINKVTNNKNKPNNNAYKSNNINNTAYNSNNNIIKSNKVVTNEIKDRNNNQAPIRGNKQPVTKISNEGMHKQPITKQSNERIIRLPISKASNERIIKQEKRLMNENEHWIGKNDLSDSDDGWEKIK